MRVARVARVARITPFGEFNTDQRQPTSYLKSDLVLPNAANNYFQGSSLFLYSGFSCLECLSAPFGSIAGVCCHGVQWNILHLCLLWSVSRWWLVEIYCSSNEQYEGINWVSHKGRDILLSWLILMECFVPHESRQEMLNLNVVMKDKESVKLYVQYTTIFYKIPSRFVKA